MRPEISWNFKKTSKNTSRCRSKYLQILVHIIKQAWTLHAAKSRPFYAYILHSYLAYNKLNLVLSFHMYPFGCNRRDHHQRRHKHMHRRIHLRSARRSYVNELRYTDLLPGCSGDWICHKCGCNSHGLHRFCTPCIARFCSANPFILPPCQQK